MIPICLWDYIHHVRYHLKGRFIGLSIGILFVMIVCQKHAQGDYIRRNVKKVNTCIPKLHHYLKFSMIFRFGGFRCNEWAVGMCTYAHKSKTRNMSYHALSIQFDQFCNFKFFTLPPIYSPYTRPQ